MHPVKYMYPFINTIQIKIVDICDFHWTFIGLLLHSLNTMNVKDELLLFHFILIIRSSFFHIKKNIYISPKMWRVA